MLLFAQDLLSPASVSMPPKEVVKKDTGCRSRVQGESPVGQRIRKSVSFSHGTTVMEYYRLSWLRNSRDVFLTVLEAENSSSGQI